MSFIKTQKEKKVSVPKSNIKTKFVLSPNEDTIFFLH